VAFADSAVRIIREMARARVADVECDLDKTAGGLTDKLLGDCRPLAEQMRGDPLVYPCPAGKLRALAGVEDFRSSSCSNKGFAQGGQTERAIKRVGQLPGKHLARLPIHHRNQVGKAPCHRDVSHVRAPHLGGQRDFTASQQIGIPLRSGRSQARARASVDRR
jgi:hypothetical protein